MGYFQADDRYLGGAGKTTVEAPWRIEVRETGEPGQVYLTWRRPYTPVDSYGIYGQDAAGARPATWRELLRVPGTAVEAGIRLEPGAWQLAVNARRSAADSALVPAVPAPPTPATQPIHIVAPLPLPDQPVPEPVMAQPLQPLYGTCNCCVPPRPLIRQGETLICPAHPERRYGVPLPFGDGRAAPGPRRREREPPPGPVPEPVPELDWTAIDSALRANSAQLGRHGLFVRPAPDDYEDRYR